MIDRLTSVDGVREERDGTPCADLLVRRPGVGAVDAAREILNILPGWLAATADEQLADALLAEGASLVRHAHVMRRALADDGLVPSGWTILPFTDEAEPPRPWADVLPNFLAAYPPDHPDHLSGGEALIEDYLIPYTRGGRLGPLISTASGLAVATETVVGGILVVDRPGEGPWISDIWRGPDPEFRGAGAALVAWSIGRLTRAGYPSLGLAVSDANPRAREVYGRAGFILEQTAWTVRLPDG